MSRNSLRTGERIDKSFPLLKFEEKFGKVSGKMGEDYCAILYEG